VTSILDAVRDRKLLGASPALHDLESWQPWLVVLAACYGLPLDVEGVELFKRCTGRSAYCPPEDGWRETVCIVGRQAGKTRIGALVTAFEAAFGESATDGELYALLLAQDVRAALRSSFSYVSTLFKSSPIMGREVASETADTLRLRNGVNVAAYPCRPASVRGLRARVVVLDELAFYKNSEGYAVDVEMLRAIRPCLATTGGKLVVLSSPYAASGALFDLHKRHFGRDDSNTLIWQASAPTMNPTLPTDYLARMREDDPEAYRSEVLGEFRQGLSTLLDPAAIDACVVSDRRELPPVSRFAYRAFADPSGGRGDAFTVAIGHVEGHGDSARAVLDVLRSWSPPFDPSRVIGEAGELLKRYRVADVTGDRYSGEFVVSEFRRHGIAYLTAEKDRSALYLALLSTVNSGRVELLDVPELLRELRTLERRTAPGGRDRVDHPRGAHDDQANSVAGCCALLLGGPARQLVRQVFHNGALRTVDAATGALVDEAGTFGRVADLTWQYDDDDVEREPVFLTESEWLKRRGSPPARPC
jgi:hypothetical protein